MERPALTVPLLAALAVLAAGSLAWGGAHALQSTGDLERRVEEVALFLRGVDPYGDPDMTYPPSAPPVFAALIAPFGAGGVKAAWLVLNLAALGASGATIVKGWGRRWPSWLKVGFVLAVAASKPVRGGIALGQFHLIPLAALLLSARAAEARRPVVAGLLAGLALTKPTMALPFLGYLAARRQWAALAAAAAWQGGCTLLTSAWLGIAPGRLVASWLALARGQQAAGSIDLPSLLARAWPGAAAQATPIALAVLALAVAATLALRRRSDLALVSLATFAAAVFTYHRSYDLVLLVPTLALLVESARVARGAGRRLRSAAALGFAALLVAPSHPSVAAWDQSLYDAAFAALAYAYLAALLVALATPARVLRGAP